MPFLLDSTASHACVLRLPPHMLFVTSRTAVTLLASSNFHARNATHSFSFVCLKLRKPLARTQPAHDLARRMNSTFDDPRLGALPLCHDSTLQPPPAATAWLALPPAAQMLYSTPTPSAKTSSATSSTIFPTTPAYWLKRRSASLSAGMGREEAMEKRSDGATGLGGARKRWERWVERERKSTE